MWHVIFQWQAFRAYKIHENKDFVFLFHLITKDQHMPEIQ